MSDPTEITEPHPALRLFESARAKIEAGTLEAAAEDAARADAAMRTGPELDPATWTALVQAQNELRKAAEAESTVLRSSMHQSGKARQAAARYRPRATG